VILKTATKWTDSLVTKGAEPESREIIIYELNMCLMNSSILQHLTRDLWATASLWPRTIWMWRMFLMQFIA